MPPLNHHHSPRMGSRSGVTTELPDSSSIPVDLITTASICLFLVFTSVGARAFTKIIDLRRIQLDDYAIFTAAACFTTFVSLFLVAADAGVGAHVWTISRDALARARLYSNLLSVMYNPTMLLAKVAVLVQIDRIFSGPRKRIIYWGVRVLIVVNVLGFTSTFFTSIFECTPRDKISNPSLPGKCITQNASIVISGAINVISDVFMLLIALWGVSTWQMTTKRKISVFFAFAIGSFGCVASVFKVYYGVSLNSNADFTEAIWLVNMWALAELTSIIVVACGPTFPRLIHYVRERTWPSISLPPAHEKWLSESTRSDDTPRPSSQFPTFSPAVQNRSHPLPPLPPPPPPPPTVSQPINSAVSPIDPGNSTDSLYMLGEAVSPVSALERPTSYFSRGSYATANLQEVMYGTNGCEPVSPCSPCSPAPTEFSQVQFGDATEVKLTPVYFATIKKTVDVRVSNQANPGSPLTFDKPEPSW